jgi:membrane dipeptidase
MLIVDGHLDIAVNALQLRRDLKKPITEVRNADSDELKRTFGTCTVTLPEMRRGGVGIAFATLMSRVDAKNSFAGTGMPSQEQCFGIAAGHLGYYRALERLKEARIIRNLSDLEDTVCLWEDESSESRIGLIIAMEGADPIADPAQVAEWHGEGLRMASLSHYGKSTYAHGTGTDGGLLAGAEELLKAFEEYRIILDLTHLADKAFWDALRLYKGPIAASHHNCRALVPGQRQLTDDMIRAIVERDGVIGLSFDLWMLDKDWNQNKTASEKKGKLGLDVVIAHVDHICQLAGNTLHVAMGSDLDGGFGVEQSPRDLDTIADLRKLLPLLSKQGYGEQDIRNIFSGNWLRLLRKSFC